MFNQKSKLHPRNKNLTGYDFTVLVKCLPELKDKIIFTKANTESIDFADAVAVKLLNKALLISQYRLKQWDIPEGYLCPPIPGRADYIHYIADLLALSNNGEIPRGDKIKILDIGTGANCIYPLIGHHEYGWYFVGSDIDATAMENANKIISDNSLVYIIEIRLQTDRNKYFEGIINPGEYFYATVCNPPFHSSLQEAIEGNSRKVQNLKSNRNEKPHLNFGGQNAELWTRGGEVKFICNMIKESVDYKSNVRWFTCLVSKSENLKKIYKEFELQNIGNYKTIEMAQGNKISRFVAWSFEF